MKSAMEEALKEEQISKTELLKQVSSKDIELRQKEELLRQQEAQMRA